MLPYNTYIQELLSINPVLSINHIHWWIMKYEKEFYSAVNSTSCRKWYKYINYGEKPFPCACPKREEDCIFIELYDKLNKLTELHKKESYFKSELLKYEQVLGGDEAELVWLERNKATGKLFFVRTEEGDIRLSIKKHQEPYLTIKIDIDRQDFKNILELKKLFSKLNNEVLKR